MGRRDACSRLEEDAWKDSSLEDVDIIGAGLDEHPDVYKDIDDVISRQSDCVKEIGEFHPKVVRMADD